MHDDKFLSRDKFSAQVENAVAEKKLTYLDAVLHICEEVKIDPEKTAQLLNMRIKDKLAVEAQELNFLEKVNKLPI